MSAQLHLIHAAPNGYDGAYEQGYNFEVYRIWQLLEDDGNKKDARLFKQTGNMDSYGDVSWHSDDMVEVAKVEKVQKIYDYMEV